MGREIKLTIFGEPASKANSRRLVSLNGSPRSIKSKKALSYSQAFREQLPVLDDPIWVPCEAHIKIWYASRRPDLDESLILDLLQVRDNDPRGIYLNDRLVRYKQISWGIDRDNPRAEICIIENPDLDPPVLALLTKKRLASRKRSG